MSSSRPDHRRIWLAALAVVLLALLGAVLVKLATDHRRSISVASHQDILDCFEELGYSRDDWAGDTPGVPRIAFNRIPMAWTDDQGVDAKKSLFLMAMAPLALMSNELILMDRARLEELADESSLSTGEIDWLTDLAQRYRVVADDGSLAGADDIPELLKRVDAVPVSLMLAQGVEESGWGTSRFAEEGNALFGQWTWGDDGIVPQQQRDGMGDYRIKAFATPLDSVEAYMLNLNSHAAYADLRTLRAQSENPSGPDLAAGLLSYSERGADYVSSLRAIISANNLSHLDAAVLADDPTYIVNPRGDGN